MKKTYVLGATANGSRIFLVYKKALKKKLEILGTPIETNKFNGTNLERFNRAQLSVNKADIIIADMSEVSTGAGIELGMAHMLNKPIYVFANKNSKVSSLIYGLTNNVKLYNDENELYELLSKTEF